MKTQLRLLSRASAATVMAACSIALAVEVTVDCSLPQQVVHGFGTCMMDWRTSPDVQDLYDDAAFRHNYVDSMGLSVVRLPVAPEILFNGGQPLDYDSISYLKAPWDFERGRVLYDWSRDSNNVAHYEFGRVDSGFSKVEQISHWARDISAIDPTVKFIGTPWSPPAWMKRKDWTTVAGDSVAITARGGILLPQYYRHFGKFLVEWVRGMQAVYGVTIYAMSLQNEPLFVESYNSCVYTRSQDSASPGTYYEAFKEVVQVFEAEGLGSMRWFGAEDTTKFPERSFAYVKPILDDPATRPYLTAVAAHGYSDGVQSVTDPSDDQKLWGYIQPYGKEYWMTETGGGEWLWPGALAGTPSMLHNMLTYGRCALVSFWQIAGSPVSGHELMDYDQHTKKSYSFMHFSKFIRPEAVRVDVSPADSLQLSASAYYHPVDSTLTVVLLNHDTVEQSVSITLRDFSGTQFEQYRTNSTDDLLKVGAVPVSGNACVLQIPRESVVSLVAHGGSTSIATQPGVSAAAPAAQTRVRSLRVVDIRGRMVPTLQAASGLAAHGVYLSRGSDGTRVLVDCGR